MKRLTAFLYIIIFSLGLWVEGPSYERGLILVGLGTAGLILLIFPWMKWFDNKVKWRIGLVACSPLAVFFLEQQSKYSINEFLQLLYFVLIIGVYQYNRKRLYLLTAVLSSLLMFWKYLYILRVSPEIFKTPQLVVYVSLYSLVSVILWLGMKLNDEKHRVTDLNMTLEERQRVLQDTNDQLEGLMDELESLTVYRERQKIAREIHDTVGHELTALTMKLELSKHFAGTDCIQSEKLLQEGIEDSRKALRSMRQVVETLTTPRRHSEDLLQLIHRHEVPNGLKVHLEGEPLMAELTVEQSHGVYRLIQEAITNCIKHSDAKDLWIQMVQKNSSIIICIQDSGRNPRVVESLREGFGLKGMRERAEELRGTFNYSYSDGFRLEMTLPLTLTQEETSCD